MSLATATSIESTDFFPEHSFRQSRSSHLRVISSGTVEIESIGESAQDASSIVVMGALQPTESWTHRLSFPVEVDELVWSAFGEIGEALFVRRNDEEGVWEVFVVAPRHSDEVYEKVGSAEAALLARHSIAIDVKVAAHQGNAVDLVIPAGAHRVQG